MANASSNSKADSVVIGFVGFWLDGEADFLSVRQHFVEGSTSSSMLRRPFFDSRNMLHERARGRECRAQIIGDSMERSERSTRVLAAFWLVTRVSAVNGIGLNQLKDGSRTFPDGDGRTSGIPTFLRSFARRTAKRA